jgi:hypothetical protein
MSLLRNIGIGMSAGLAGAAAMHGFRLAWEAVLSRDNRHTIFGFDHEADVNAARIVYELFSKERLPDQPAGRIGLAMHYLFGAGLGILYQVTWRTAGSDAAFGMLLWLCADEIPISLSGISDSFAKSAASHASALAAHVIFAGVTGRTARLL